MASHDLINHIRQSETHSPITMSYPSKLGEPVLVAGLDAFAERYDLFIVDQWGVLHDGLAAFPGAITCLHQLSDMGKRVVILSNSGKRAAANAVRLAKLGIDESGYTALITSGEVARACLATRIDPFLPSLGRRCLLLQSDSETSLVDGLDIDVVRTVDEASFILLAGVADEKPMDYYKPILLRASAKQIPLVCANPDMMRFSPRGLTFSAGEVARRYEEMGGEVHYIGKPYPAIYEYCCNVIPDVDPSRVIAIGDSLFHDVVGAARAGMHTAFVTNGIHKSDFSGLQSDAQRLEVVCAMAKDYGVRPNWVIPQFQWKEDTTMSDYVASFEHLRNHDVASVGGKNASLGEMITQLSAKGVRVPSGFATTAQAYREFLAHNGLAARIHGELESLDVDDVSALTACGAKIRQWILAASLPAPLEHAIARHYQALAADSAEGVTFAVRSSATAEDLPDASFAGQQETFLNIVGLDNILHAIKEVFASLYNDRAIAYRVHKGFTHADVALSAGVQRMVRSDMGSAGVMFTLDTESGFQDVVFITSSYGLGETVVQGAVNPDEFYVHKPLLAQGHPAIVRRTMGSKRTKMVFGDSRQTGQSTATQPVDARDSTRFSLTDAEILELARYAVIIERHYGRPMDIEWGKDGIDGKLYILQARPETVKSRQTGAVETFKLETHGESLISGRAVTQKIGVGRVRIVKHLSEMDIVQPGDILVADMTDPNWEPVMKRASALVTNRGGRTCHAAIIARELGIPAIVGCGNATEILLDGDTVTVSCSEGETGHVYAGALDYKVDTQEADSLPALPVKIMMNVGNPDMAFKLAGTPNQGVGLARLEFVINNMVGIHPKAILNSDSLPAALQGEIQKRASGYASPRHFYIEKLAEGVATIAAAFYPKPVIVRLSDFKSNEYRKLIGGEIYEPEEENPMLGFRGAARYIADDFRDCFELECVAMRKVREEIGLTNVELMIPFVRTLQEAQSVVDILAGYGLKRGENGLRLIMMCEVPSNALLAGDFLHYFDGFSIGSNDITQLTLGIDRDSGLMAHGFDERNAAVKALLRMTISTCNRLGKYVGICGQGPSDHPDFAEWLLAEGIQSMSLNPDTVIHTSQRLAALTK